ncbi:hypothetical protein [Bauldia sp.]|uniref:hypothetical protein n=1 Tax=Bauldia sp. TaxID=2575872 RepID=UPI003BACC258
MTEQADLLLGSMEDVFAPFMPDDIAESSRKVVHRYLEQGAGRIGQIAWAEFDPDGVFSRGGISNASHVAA